MIKVLIVDDDPMVAELNKRYVENFEGFKVKSIMNNGEDALEYLNHNPIDLIILDVYMPKLDGLSLLEKLRKQFIKTDVILVTAAKDSSEIDKALKLGVVDYLIKPFDSERIKKALGNYLNRYKIIHAKDTFSQNDIDLITNINAMVHDENSEKGVHKNTLKRIRDFMKKNDSAFLTSEIISDKMGISKVTVRRYLEYLEHNDEIIIEIEYGSLGRPSYLYKLKN